MRRRPKINLVDAEVGCFCAITHLTWRLQVRTIQGTKEMLLYARDHSVEEGLNHVATWNAAMLQSDDLKKAIMTQMTLSGCGDLIRNSLEVTHIIKLLVSLFNVMTER
jgi:hypothetical protein